MKYALRGIAFATTLLLAGCGLFGTINEKEKDRTDITAAIQKYLNERSGLNMSAMNWEITEFSQDRDRAKVTVMFTAKENADAKMPVTYELLRAAGVWSVQKPASGAGHPGLDPPQQPAPQGGAMPPGHPPIGGSEPMKSQPPKKQ